MKTSSTKKKRPTTRAGRRGMTLAEWHRQNQWPDLLDCQTTNEGQQVNESTGQQEALDWQTADSYGKIMGLHPEDAALIAQLWEESRHRGIRFSTLARMYFPKAESLNAAKARLCYELRCCHGLSEALERLHHPKKFCRFTCAQVRAIFLLYGSPGA